MSLLVALGLVATTTITIHNTTPHIRVNEYEPLFPAGEHLKDLPHDSNNLPAIACNFSWAESSGGQFRVHDLVTVGVNKGTRSVSSYGLMPLTVKELLKTKFAYTYTGRLVKQAVTPRDINKITENQYHDNVAFIYHWKNVQASVKKIVPLKHSHHVSVLAHYAGVTGAYRFYKANGFQGVKNHWYVKKVLDTTHCQ